MAARISYKIWVSSTVLAGSFLTLSLLATLFPPFIWGEELLQSDISLEQKLTLSQSGGLPIKRYGFLFGDSKQRVYTGVWLWDQKQKASKPLYALAQRKLLVSELVLEYVLAFIVASCLAIVAYVAAAAFKSISGEFQHA